MAVPGMPMGQAAVDLGFGGGDLLTQQLQEQTEEARKRRLAGGVNGGAQAGNSPMGPAALALLGVGNGS